MRKRRKWLISAIVVALGGVIALTAVIERNPWVRAYEQWTTPFPPFRIIGNLYYVGTYDLACYLIVTTDGDILVNTGMWGSTPLIRSNIEALGFKLSDIKLLMVTHAHVDHVAAMAEVKRSTGAKMLAMDAEAPLITSGGGKDYRYWWLPLAWFAPVTVDGTLHDEQKVQLGEFELTVHHHPGHTKGAESISFQVQENGRDYQVLIANMPGINPGVRLLHNSRYPDIAADYAHTLEAMKQLSPDVFLASHASQFGLHGKYKPGDAYEPDRFVDPDGYRTAIARLERAYHDELDREMNQP